MARTSNGSELRILIGGRAGLQNRQESEGRTNYFEEVQKKETWWRDYRIDIFRKITGEARLEISLAFKAALRKMHGEIPDLLEERELRGSHEYLSLKRGNPEAAQSVHGLGIGIMERFNRTIDQTLCKSMMDAFGGLMEELVLSNRIHNVEMPSAKADTFADKYIDVIKAKVVRLKDSTIAQLETSSNTDDMAVIDKSLSEGAYAIIIAITEDVDKIKEREFGGRHWFSRGSA